MNACCATFACCGSADVETGCSPTAYMTLMDETVEAIDDVVRSKGLENVQTKSMPDDRPDLFC